MKVITDKKEAREWMDYVRFQYAIKRATIDDLEDAEEALVRAELAWGVFLGRRDLVIEAQNKLDELMHAEEMAESILKAVDDWVAEKEAEKARASFRIVS